jgi:hypothetical protein
MPITALVLPVSGAYTSTWDGNALGTQNDDGFVLNGSFTGQEVNMSDAFGMTLVEAIWRGINWRLRFRGLEFNKPGILQAIQAFGSRGNPLTTFTPTLENIGDRYSAFTRTLSMVANLGVTTTMPQTLTALGAILSPNSNMEFLMTSKVREAPIEMVLLPYESALGGAAREVSFTTT